MHIALSYVSKKIDSLGLVPFQGLMSQDMTLIEPANQITGIASLTSESTLFIINGTFDLQSMDLILYKSRKNNDVDVCMKPIRKLVEYDLPDSGIQISAQQICINISCEEGKVEVLTNLHGVKFTIFRYRWQMGNSIDMSELKNLLRHSLDCICEMSFSNCTLTIWLGSLQNASSPGSVTNGFNSSTPGCETSCTEDNSPSSVVIERSSVRSSKFGWTSDMTSLNFVPVTNYWFLMNMTLSEIFITRCSVKNILLEAHQTCKLQSLLSVGGEFQRISWEIQVLISLRIN